MKVFELTKSQKTALKQNYYCERNDNVSWGELAEINTLVSDDEIFAAYADIDFCNDDFPSVEL